MPTNATAPFLRRPAGGGLGDHADAVFVAQQEVLSAIDKVFKKPPEVFATLAKMLGFDKPRKKKKKK